MRAKLHSLHSPDVDDLAYYIPENPETFGILVQAMVGPLGGDGEESIYFLVCTPQWLATQIPEGEYRFGRHCLFLKKYEYRVLHAAIEKLCHSLEEADWGTLARKLGAYGRWEFEHYRE